jgi:hypothetical protein
MTETEWLTCTDPELPINFLANHFEIIYERAYERAKELKESGYDADKDPAVRAIARRMRLFAVACCRHIGHLLIDPRSWQALEWTERFVDNLASEDERREVAYAAGRVTWDLESDWTHCSAASAAYSATDDIMDEFEDAQEVAKKAAEAAASVHDPESQEVAFDAEKNAEETFQSRLLREIFGNPFRPVALDRSWLTDRVVALAQAAYEERSLTAGILDPDRLAVLSDALEDAGCTDTEILSHLRGPGPHVRGCWALDLVLERA